MTTFTRFFPSVLLIVEFLLIIGCTVPTEQDRLSGTAISETTESAGITPTFSPISSTVIVTPTRTLNGTDEDSLIVFAALNPGAENIWEGTTLFTITSNGETQQQLTFTNGFRSDVALSPDGNQIAYSEDDANNDAISQIFIMNIDGTNVTQLTFHDSRNISPSWSPDGRKLAYQSNRTGDWQIYLLDLETMESIQLTSEGVNASPGWSPDGTQIVFEGVRELSGDPSFSEAIYIMDEDGSNQTPLVNECEGQVFDPVWNPDGRQIAFTCEVPNPITDQFVGKIHIMESDGSDVRQLTSNDPSIFEFRPKWSPDGMSLMYIQSDDDVNVLYIFDLVTGETVRLANTENVWAADW